jgi:hypothetical protein
MAKDKISDYSSTANSNTDIAGINIDEGCAPSGINDAIRTLMAQLKTWQSGSQDVYIHPAGSASAPSITANGDTNTGIFFPAADTVGITTGGTERARVDSSGNMGLGVTPSAWGTYSGVLDLKGNGSLAAFNQAVTLWANAFYNGTNIIYKTSTGAGFYQIAANQHQWYNAPSGTAGGTVTMTQAMTLDASGNLGVGTTSPNGYSGYGAVTLNGSSGGLLDMSVGNTRTGSLYAASTQVSLSSRTAIPLVFETNSLERARIDSSGRLLVGKTSAGDTVLGTQIGGDGYITATRSDSTNANTTYHVYSTAVSAYRFYVGMAGTVFATSTTISAISDIRFKENVRDLDAGLAEVMALKPRLYDWKEGKGADIKNARGFIAQEFEEVFPDLIDEWRDPAPEGEEPYKSVRADLIPVLVKAIQEQQALIAQLQADVAALKGQA